MSHNTTADSALDTTWTWKNRPGYKPILMLIATIVLIAIVLLPPPQNMIDMVSRVNPPGYNLEADCKTITDTVNRKLRPSAFKVEKLGKPAPANHKDEQLLSPQEVAQIAKIMVAILFTPGCHRCFGGRYAVPVRHPADQRDFRGLYERCRIFHFRYSCRGGGNF